MSFTVELGIFSPRWGHEDIYSVELSREFMRISLQARTASAIWRDGHDPEWSGDSILDIMSNDSIYAPAVIQDLFEYVWKEWRGGKLSDSEANGALQEVAGWLNAVTHAKPESEFWRKYF